MSARKTSAIPLFLLAFLWTPFALAEVTDRDEIDLARVSGYFSRLKHLEGGFVQIAPDGGKSTGHFYLRRPWRMRFEYDPPQTLLLVADGVSFIVQDTGTGLTDRYPLRSTPARFLLAPALDLKKQARVLSVDRPPGRLHMALTGKESDPIGRIVLRFRDAGTLALESWLVIDAQGRRTEVLLQNVKQGQKAPARLFQIEEKDPFVRRR